MDQMIKIVERLQSELANLGPFVIRIDQELKTLNEVRTYVQLNEDYNKYIAQTTKEESPVNDHTNTETKAKESKLAKISYAKAMEL